MRVFSSRSAAPSLGDGRFVCDYAPAFGREVRSFGPVVDLIAGLRPRVRRSGMFCEWTVRLEREAMKGGAFIKRNHSLPTAVSAALEERPSGSQ